MVLIARLNWEKANKQDYAKKHGAVRAEPEQPGKANKQKRKKAQGFKPSFTRPRGVRTNALDKDVDSAPGKIIQRRRGTKAAKASLAKKRKTPPTAP